MADDAARAASAAAFAGLADGEAAVIDGLALPGAEPCLEAAAARLRLVGFIHHPLALETGLAAAAQAQLAALEARLLPLLRGAICPSAETARALVGYGVRPERIAVCRPAPTSPRPQRPIGRAARSGCSASPR